MPTTTVYRFGDLVLVPFPFTDQTGTKKRPAVVVSSEVYHRTHIDVVVMAVTSQILRPANVVGEVLIIDWQRAGLPKASLIKPVFATLEHSLILRKLGDLQEPDKQALRQALLQVLGSAAAVETLVPLLPRCYPDRPGAKGYDRQVVEELEPALGLEPRTC